MKAINRLMKSIACVAMTFALVTSAHASTLKIFVLTGQSNSLGTLATTDDTMGREAPGTHVAEQSMAVPFFWDNRADETPEGDAGLGDSGGVWVDLGPQLGGYYPNNDDHWGPEIGFARMLWNAGYRDFAIVKASRGGGGNTYWVKDSADDHMYDHVVATVNAAVTTLPAGYTGYEIAGLLYLQGESNDATEADEADTRFSDLLTNLKTDLSNAASLTGVFGEIGGGSTLDRDLTRTQQLALATARADIGYASAAGTEQHDGLHYAADSQLLMGERMAAAMITTGALGIEPLPAWTNLYAWYVADNAAQPGSYGLIERWANLSGGSVSNDLTRTVNGWPTTRSVTATNDQPRKVMRFDGGSDLWASKNEFVIPSGSPRSVAMLCNVRDAGNGFLFDGATVSGKTRAQVRDNDWQVGVADIESGWDTGEAATEPRTFDQWQRHVFTFADNGTATDVTHWIDGVQVASFSDPDQADLRGFIVACNGGSPWSLLDCDIAEIAVYDKVLDSADVAALETDWQSRWGTPSGPPFDIEVVQFPSTIPRFGRHGLLRIGISSPQSGISALDEVSVSLKDGSWSRVTELALLNGGGSAGFNPLSPVLGTVASPSSNTISFAVSVPLAEGENYLWLSVVPERYADLDSTIDALVGELVFSGTNAGAVVPADGDPVGELALGLVPLSSDVRVRGAHGLGCIYRIPGIACDSNGVLHTVYDNRYDFGGDLPGDVDVGYSRSIDGGATWEPQKVILDFDSSVPGSSGNGVGDPCILWDPVTDTLWVAALWSFGENGYHGSGPGLDPEDTGQYVLTKSTDGGDTWSDPINITADIKHPNWNLLFQGPGHGLAMRDGTIVFPSQVRDGTIENDGINQVRACSVYSTDHGDTWQFGSIVPTLSPQQNENTVCELDDGRLLFSCRTPVGSNGQRAWVHYNPGGVEPMQDGTWEPLYRLPSVPDPVCQGSVIQWKSTFDGHPKEWILFANPATGGRNGMTLRVSMDGGLTWPISRLVYSGPSAYSALCILPDGSIGLLYEKDGYNSINFVRVEEGWLLDPDADFDGDGMSDSWEILWGTDPAVPDADADPDGDGLTNIEERGAGTDPQDGGSRFWISNITLGSTTVQLVWDSIPGKAYRISQSDDLITWTSTIMTVVASGSQTTVDVPLEEGVTKRFYRTTVVP